MLGFAVIAIAIVVTGTAVLSALSLRLDGPHDLSPPELLTGGAVTGLALWIAIHWALAMTHALTRPAVVAVSLAFVAAAVAAVIRNRRSLKSIAIPKETAIAMAFLAPVFAWMVFILWRGTVTPPLSHDALAYHLPKAVLMMRAHGYEQFVAPDARIGGLPANYEMLLADVLILSSSDRLTEWIGTASFILVLLATAAIARRWGIGVAGTAAAVLAVASAPVVLLHSGADKNDLLVAWMGLAALSFGSRWCVQGGRMNACVAIAAATLGIGTKPNIATVAAALAPFALWRIWRLLRERTLRVRDAVATAIFCASAFLLCGGWTYIFGLISSHAAATGSPSQTSSVAPALATMTYGDWFNLWQVPWLLLTIPFAPSANGVWVPWAHEYWFWPHYELYWSHYGFAFTAAAVLLPFAAWRYRRLPADRARMRRIACAGSVIAVMLMLPVVSRPIGFYGTYPRYLLVALPLLYAYTFAPIADELWQRRRPLAFVFLGALAVIFSYYSAMSAEHDRFAPLEYVVWASRHPGTRAIPFMGGRAGSVVDRRAGPHDKIAVHGSFETWVYPAYGAALTRPVVFLPSDATPADVPADADWVMVDRSWHTIWAEGMQDMGDGWTKLAKGTANPDEVRFTESMERDPRFRLVYRDKRFNQAVFRRVSR